MKVTELNRQQLTNLKTSHIIDEFFRTHDRNTMSERAFNRAFNAACDRAMFKADEEISDEAIMALYADKDIPPNI